jgi:hypothetical protein
MKYLMLLVSGVFLFLSSEPAVADQGADIAAIRQVRERRIATYNTKDVKIFEDTVVEDHESWSGVKGRASLIRRTAALFENQWKDIVIEQLEEIGIIFVTPDVAIFKSRQRYIGTLDEAGGVIPPMDVLFAEVYLKRNGRWLAHSWFWRPID